MCCSRSPLAEMVLEGKNSGCRRYVYNVYNRMWFDNLAFLPYNNANHYFMQHKVRVNSKRLLKSYCIHICKLIKLNILSSTRTSRNFYRSHKLTHEQTLYKFCLPVVFCKIDYTYGYNVRSLYKPLLVSNEY